MVWGLRTHPSKAIRGHTPFFMVYGSDAIIPADLIHGAPRVAFNNIAEAEKSRAQDLDMLEEERLDVILQVARYQQSLKRYYDKNVKIKTFNIGDLVLKRKNTTMGQSKLSSPWEGPYIISEVLEPATFRLEDEDGIQLTNTSNSDSLRRFYA